MPAHTPYMPKTDAGVAAMLVAFDTNANGALATKYGLTSAELNRVRQARYVWQGFIDALAVGRDWAQGMTAKRDLMISGAATGAVAFPAGPTMPAVPMYTPLPTGSPTAALMEPGFFEFFAGLVARIKKAQNYDVADGETLGIEGAVIAPPSPSIVPVVEADLFHSGQPELTVRKGVFQGYSVWLTRPGQARKPLPFSTARRYTVNEPLPAPGTAEIWTFEVQYHYQNAPFGQVSQPVQVTVRG